MSTRIGLISDVHSTPEPVAEALALFEAHGTDIILCPGDIAGYGNDLEATVALLLRCGCHAVLGNHEIWYLDKHAEAAETPAIHWFRTLPRTLELTIEGQHVYMVHASPPDSYMDGIKLLDLDGNVVTEERRRWTDTLLDFDSEILLVGHTHQVFCEQLGKTLVINPGSTKFNHACSILKLPERELEVFPLSGKQIVKSWNWGMMQIDAGFPKT